MASDFMKFHTSVAAGRGTASLIKKSNFEKANIQHQLCRL
jgi:hypothetical protein